jgi:cytochrome c553
LLVLGLVACTAEPEQQVENIKQESVAQNKSNEQNKDVLPALHIQPAVYDLGDIKEGEAAIATFFIRNNSKQSIELVDIQASCGCTAAEPDSFIIAPNSFTQLKVAVDTTAKQDDIKKAIYITDSLGHKATAMLTFNVIDNPHFSMKKGGVKSIFDGKCASCHYQPLVGVNAPNKLYEVGCAMCHGENAEGAYAPSLRGHSFTALQQTIAHGVGTRQMPGFAESKGGPLTDTPIKNLATWLTSLPQSTK